MAELGAQQRTLASVLRLAVVRLNRRLRAQRTESTVSLSQLAALSTLHRCGPLTPTELAAKEGVQPPSMTRVITALEAGGYVTRQPHPTDGRQAIVSLSDQGTAFCGTTVSLREAWLERRLAALTEREREVLAQAADIIGKITGN